MTMLGDRPAYTRADLMERHGLGLSTLKGSIGEEPLCRSAIFNGSVLNAGGRGPAWC